MIDTGGPYHPDPGGQLIGEGATLLDHFAGEFGQAMLSNTQSIIILLNIAKDKNLNYDKALSMMAYEFTQAMITEKRRLEKVKS